MCKLGVISQEWLKIEVKLLLSANRKSYMPRRLAQQRMTLSDLEWLKSASSALHAMSVIAELLVYQSDHRTHSSWIQPWDRQLFVECWANWYIATSPP